MAVRNRLTWRFTPQLGLRSTAADTKSFPYFLSKIFLSATSSGISEHLGAANIKLAIPSFKSAGHSLKQVGLVSEFQACHFYNKIMSSETLYFCFEMIASLATTNSQKSSMNSFAAKTFCSLMTCSTYKATKIVM